MTDTRLMQVAMMLVYRSPLAPAIAAATESAKSKSARRAALEALLDTDWNELWTEHLAGLVAEVVVDVEPTDAIRDELRSMVLSVAETSATARDLSSEDPPREPDSGTRPAKDVVECPECGRENQAVYKVLPWLR